MVSISVASFNEMKQLQLIVYSSYILCVCSEKTLVLSYPIEKKGTK